MCIPTKKSLFFRDCYTKNDRAHYFRFLKAWELLRRDRNRTATASSKLHTWSSGHSTGTCWQPGDSLPVECWLWTTPCDWLCHLGKSASHKHRPRCCIKPTWHICSKSGSLGQLQQTNTLIYEGEYIHVYDFPRGKKIIVLTRCKPQKGMHELLDLTLYPESHIPHQGQKLTRTYVILLKTHGICQMPEHSKVLHLDVKFLDNPKTFLLLLCTLSGIASHAQHGSPITHPSNYNRLLPCCSRWQWAQWASCLLLYGSSY